MTLRTDISPAERHSRDTLAADRILSLLDRHLDAAGGGLSSQSTQRDDRASRLDDLVRIFGLSDFERRLLCWCAAVELDVNLADATSNVAGSSRPSFRAAMLVLPEPDWHATAPFGALRRWMLVSPGSADLFMDAPLMVEECIFDYLVGLPFSDPRLDGWLTPVVSSEPSLSHRRLAELLAARFEAERVGPLHARLSGDALACETVAAHALNLGGYAAAKMFAVDLPSTGPDVSQLGLLWSRQAAVSRTGLVLSLPDDASATLLTTIGRFARTTWGPLIVLGGKEAGVIPGIPDVEVAPIDREERVSLFRMALGDVAVELNGQIERTAANFDLGMDAISSIAAEFKLRQDEPESDTLWNLSRRHGRPEIGVLAERIDSHASWEDLVLPTAQMNTLREIGSHVRNRLTVYETWGFAEKSSRGLGISALFHGPSGTGKTLAAEVLANELSLDVYRIDLSAVVSKYIGETEKNLSKIFDAAEAAPVVLLFDEADALFGKRSEVRDSHDRYANLEVSYLLQRVEAFRGLAILTTNMKSALDQAFLRRIRFLVQFPFPDQQQRGEIWKRMFPKKAPLENIEYARLARLNVPGGHIRNIAMNAAFRAVEEGSPITMRHLQQAARAEYEKLDRPLSEIETRGWA